MALIMPLFDEKEAAAKVAGLSALEKRHQPSGENSAFDFPAGTPFAEYVAAMRAKVASVRAAAFHRHDELCVDANSPFEWVPSAEAETLGSVLLVHGLTDSPFLMRDVGAHFRDQGYHVRAIAMPGHAMIPGDLLEVRFESWVESVAYGIRSFAGSPGPLFVVGFSTGCAAALHTQLEGELRSNATGLVLLSPAIEPKSRLSFMANWHKALALVRSDQKAAEAQWLEVATDDDYAKHESFPKNAGDQIHLLSKAVRELGPDPLEIPMFMALSLEDETVSAKSAIRFFAGSGHDESRMLLYTNQPADEKDRDDPRVTRHPSAFPNEKVIDFSHTAIPVAPGNPHYGRAGDYRSAMHYLGEAEKWQRVKDGDPDVKLGETSEVNLGANTIQRLTYNPDFAGMVAEIDAFVARIRAG